MKVSLSFMLHAYLFTYLIINVGEWERGYCPSHPPCGGEGTGKMPSPPAPLPEVGEGADPPPYQPQHSGKWMLYLAWAAE